MAKKAKSFLIGRDAGTGRLKKVSAARKDKRGSTVEHMPKRGKGTAK